MDIESIPRDDIAEIIPTNSDLANVIFKTAVPEGPAKTEKTTDMMSPSEFVSQGLDAMKEVLAKTNPTDEWLAEAIEEENKLKKPRKGAQELLQNLLDAQVIHDKALAEAIAARNKEASVTPELLQIVSIAYASDYETPQCLIQSEYMSEKDILLAFWDLAAQHKHIVTFNGLHFDIPAIFVRSMLLGVNPTKAFSFKPWDSDIIDLAKRRYPSGQMRGQKWLAKALGIETASDADGSMVLDMWRAGELEKLADYNKSDVADMQAMLKLMKGFFV